MHVPYNYNVCKYTYVDLTHLRQSSRYTYVDWLVLWSTNTILHASAMWYTLAVNMVEMILIFWERRKSFFGPLATIILILLYCRGVGSTDTLICRGGVRKRLRSSYYVSPLSLRSELANREHIGLGRMKLLRNRHLCSWFSHWNRFTDMIIILQRKKNKDICNYWSGARRNCRTGSGAPVLTHYYKDTTYVHAYIM